MLTLARTGQWGRVGSCASALRALQATAAERGAQRALAAQAAAAEAAALASLEAAEAEKVGASCWRHLVASIYYCQSPCLECEVYWGRRAAGMAVRTARMRARLTRKRRMLKSALSDNTNGKTLCTLLGRERRISTSES